MRKLFLFFFVCISCYSFGQNAAEMFAQKKTIIKYLTQQVAALKIYSGYVKEGYSVAREGLHLISDIKKGDFSLHSDYFNSLKKINPEVAHYAKIKGIISCQVNIIKSCKSGYKRMKESGAFTEKEIAFIYSVFAKELGGAAEIIDELMIVLTPDGYQMKDDERLHRIDKLYIGMQDRQTFVQHFSNESYVLSILRKKEKEEVETSKFLNNIK